MTGFQIPTLEDWRTRGRDYVLANIPPRSVILPNSPLRVLTDGSAGMSYMVMLYLAELAEQLLPDTAQGEWLRRHAAIWLSGGAKSASAAVGIIALTGVSGTIVAQGATYTVSAPDGTAIIVETVADATLGDAGTPVAVRALTVGAAGNLAPGTRLNASRGQQGLLSTATVVALTGGVDAETDDELRVRVLDRIQRPPMGGDADDYVAWALEVPGVTRAWCSPNEMGMGTVTVRFMCDDLRASTGGFPSVTDVAAVQAHIDAVRPVTVLDAFVVAPIPFQIDFGLQYLSGDSVSTRAAIEASVKAMLLALAKPAHCIGGIAQPAQTIYAAWVSDAIYQTAGADYFDLLMNDQPMPTNGSIAILGSVS